ncbi:MAG: phenylalanine--tRNA ligase subunit beta, partial [Candidatus Adiutrix sp.]|nr:phenylalanine--tRNA ligase subunit beta [Candidatus Adiutrix sp.]
MKASLEWLGDFVDLAGFSPREIADKLTLAGLEVEDLRDRFAHLGRVVAARLERAEPLAGAGNEHLRLWDVSAGDAGCFRVVCGAPNARVGLVAPLALAGAVLPGDREVRAARIFGRTSEGMLCSAAELGLGSDAAGLMELEAEPGRTLKEITGRADWALEIGITPNRPDALSILGLARDLAALLDRPLTQPAVRIREEGPDIHTLAKVSIEDPEHCRRFA